MESIDIYSHVKNQHDAGIIDENNENLRPVPKNQMFRFFSTASYESLMEGIDVDLNMSYDPSQCRDFLIKILIDKKILKDRKGIDLLIYLSGGIPFLGGTLNDLYTTPNLPRVKKYIYGILTRPVSNDALSKIYYGFFNINDDMHKIMLSPICDSTNSGLCDMACLLGYLNNDGSRSYRLLKSSAAIIRFPPLTTCLNRIIERMFVTGRDIITVCSTFYTFFRYMIKSVMDPDKVFEYALRCCNIISHIKNIPIELPIKAIDLSKGNMTQLQFLRNLNQPQLVYMWLADYGQNFSYVKLEPVDLRAIEDANKSFASFAPIAPLSTRFVIGCSIVKGKEHNYLYLSQSAVKGSTNLVDMYDPLDGKSNIIDIEKFAKMQGNSQIDNVANLIDQDQVKQIIMVCFDRSYSMNSTLDGNAASVNYPSRTVIATQYLISLANKLYGYRIPCILGLIEFNHIITIRCPLSPLVPDFEDKGLKNIVADGNTHLWDALSLACDELVKFSNDEKGKSRFRAIKRIIVISDGEDVGSSMNSEIVTKKLLINNIIVDSVFASSVDFCKELAVVSHITSGVAIRPSNINQGMSFFEQNAFLDTNEREKSVIPIIPSDRKTIPRNIKPDMITENFIQQAMQNVKYDQSIANKPLSRITLNKKISSPRYICYMKQNEIISNTRERRVLRELHYAALIMDPSSPQFYDPDLKIYPMSQSLYTWQIYMRAPECEPYNGKWFFLVANLPENYPMEPPIIRFISIPYNLNVSSEGRICLDILEKGYISSFHVVDIIRQAKEIFLIPNVETPIQIEILDTYLHERKKYDELARKSAMEKGRDDYKAFFPDKLHVQDDVDDKYKLSFDSIEKVPKYMISQISGRVMKDPSTGGVYDREEVKQLVASNRRPICVITGKVITETVDQIDVI